MLGPKQEAQGALFHEFSIDHHVPQDHLLSSIVRFVDLSSIRPHPAKFYSHTGRQSIDPELLIRILLALPRHQVRAQALRGGASQPCLPLVLPP